MKDRSIRFEDAAPFFEHGGSVWMKLSRPAALQAIRNCTERGIAISIVEGGIWHTPGFEARLDAIWHSRFDKTAPTNSDLELNNLGARSFLNELPPAYDTAIISTFGNWHG